MTQTPLGLRSLRHLLSRSGFGPSLHDWHRWTKLSLSQAQDKIFEEAQAYKPIPQTDHALPQWGNMRDLTDEERREIREQGALALRELNVAWIQTMVNDPAQLREKMAFFWHDHFACRFQVVFLAKGQLERFRKLALGKFGDLLLSISQDPGMLRFLNNQQNRKEAPNENFARELLELFTLGRGHYTETDIKEAARAFTGWGFNLRKEFIFKPRWHDYGSKTFLGQTGNWNGEDIIRIILEQKRTAYFLVEKLYRYLVHPTPDPQMVSEWADYFYQEKYDIEKLLRKIFSSNHFYDLQNQGSLIKSPVEYLVSLLRLSGAKFQDPQGYLRVQKVLGQTLFQPPNVAGWPYGREWIDSSTLMARLQIPRAMLAGESLRLTPKESFAGNEDAIKLKGNARRLMVEINWPHLEKLFGEHFPLEMMTDYLLTQPLTGAPLEGLNQHLAGLSFQERLKGQMAYLLSSPEFQLC